MGHMTPTIVIDTREQLPYSFEGLPTITQKLEAGDYSILGFEDVVTIERKSLDDLVKSLINDRKRFLKVAHKMKDYPHSYLVVECSLRDIYSRHYASGAHPNSILGAIVSVNVDYGIPVILAGDRQHACWFTQQLLITLAERLNCEKEVIYENMPGSGGSNLRSSR